MTIDSPQQITVEDVRSWLQRHAAVTSQISDLQSEAEGLARKIEAARVLFSSLEEEEVVEAKRYPTDPASIETWGDLVFYTLAKAQGGRTQAQILETGKETAIADRVRRSPNGVYVAVKKMVAREDIVKDGQHFYLPDTWAAICRGEIEDDKSEAMLNAGSVQQIVFAYMRDGESRRPREIADMLNAHPSTSKRALANPAYIYNLLGRMLRTEKIRKLPDGSYELVHKENEPLAELPLSGPDAEGGATPSFENVLGFNRTR